LFEIGFVLGGGIQVAKKNCVCLIVCINLLVIACMLAATESQAQDKPDDTHYIFAHKALPSLLFTRQEALFRAFENRGQSFVEDLWAEVAKTTGVDADSRNKELKYSKENISGINVYVIKLPPPKAMAEAYYVALLEKDKKPRYFTLELTYKGSSCADSTMLGEWLAEGRHRNYGCGPKPEKQELLKAIAGRL